MRQVDAPSRNVWPGPRLVDHLLVELADAAAVGQVHAVEAAVGDRAGVGHRELERALARADRVLHAVPDDPRAQLGELLGRVAAVEHVEHRVEQLARQLRERVGAPDQVVQLGHLPLVAGRGHRRRSAGRARRAGCAARRSARCRRRACAWRPPRTRAGRRGTWGRCGPRETSPTPWPARPMRCSPAVTDFGDSTWITRSTAPMSMPSSSEVVATRQGSSPDLSRSSTTSRSSRASEPWWARAIVGGLVRRPPRPPARSAAPPAARRRGGC